MRTFLMILAGLAIALCLAWGLQSAGLISYRFFAPKYEAARRMVFEQTKSYTQGQIQELENMEFEYVQADPGHKDALASIILHRAADFDEARLPADLRTFIDHLRDTRAHHSTGGF